MRSITLFNHAAQPVSLRFVDRKLEEQFRAQYIENHLWQIQVAQVLAMILYTLAVVSEIVIFRLHTPSAYIRLVVVVSSFATGLLLTFMAKDFYMRPGRDSVSVVPLMNRSRRAIRATPIVIGAIGAGVGAGVGLGLDKA